MPGFLLHMNATIQCSHAASAMLPAQGARVRAMGHVVAVQGDRGAVSACPFQIPVGPGTKPQPCVAIIWTVPALRVRVMGKFALLVNSPGICQSAEQIPQGSPLISVFQTRVRGS